jgi:hypothetical protein
MKIDQPVVNGDGSHDVVVSQMGDGYTGSGDSGGPAIYNGAVVGELCCGNSTPDGNGSESYSSVANSLSWITSVTGIGGGGTTPPPPAGNLALNKTTKGSAPCAASEATAKAVNGSVTGGNADKWCSAVAGTKQIQVDLGSSVHLSKLTVKHAQAGGEPASLNTKNFVLEASTGGGVWTTVATVTGNTASITNSAVNVSARWIRLSTADPIARVYEFEAYS